MFRRYVIKKINHRTNCYQGLLVTLGTMKHKGQLSDSETAEVESLFAVLNDDLPTPPNIESEVFRDSISWFKKDAVQFDSFEEQMRRAARILKSMGHEILILETAHLHNILYEDAQQVLVKAGINQFQILHENI